MSGAETSSGFSPMPENALYRNKKLYISSDHAGFDLKEYVKGFLAQSGQQIEDLGPEDTQSVDYPDYGIKLALALTEDPEGIGILVCGTGIGMSMVVNRFPRIRGALCHEIYTAKMSRAHNDANVLILGGRVIGKGLAEDIVSTWLDTPFEGGRHQRRVDKIESKNAC